jgi:glycosyltransferase involved in cell wall biosynthesis
MVKQKRICIISFYFPPMNAIGYLRPLRLANHAAAEGREVVVLMGSPSWARRFVPSDPALSERVDKRVKVVTIPTFHLFSKMIELRNALSRGGRVAPGTPASEPGVRRKAKGPFKTVLEAIQQLFLIPDRYGSFVLTGFLGYLRHCLIARPDCIYVTGPPWSPMVLGWLVSKIFGIPLTLDYRDPWNHNPYNTEMPHPSIHWALEHAALRQSRCVIFNTESMRKLYVDEQPDLGGKSVAIYNGVDEDLVREMQLLHAEAARTPALGHDHFRVIHAGRLYAQRMPPNLADILFRFMGGAENVEILRHAFEIRGVGHKLELTGMVTTREAKLALLRSDSLLLLQLGTKIQLPAKIFEMALVGKPIVCFADEGSEASSFVRDYGLGTLFESAFTAADIHAAFVACLEQGSSKRNPPEAFLRDYSGKDRAADLLGVVESGPTELLGANAMVTPAPGSTPS